MRSEFVFFLAAIGAAILNVNPSVEAAPVRFVETSQSPVAGRVHIKPQSHPTKSSNPPHKHSHKHRRQYSHKAVQLKTINDVVPRRNIPPPNPWFSNTQNRARAASALILGGHAVVDEDDDDDGNELLDIEPDLILPDDDDTIEGQILEEEEDDDLILAYDRAAENQRGQASFIIPDVVINNDDSVTEDEDLVPLNYDDEIDIEDEFEPTLEEEAKEEIVATLSKFGGNRAAAELAAEEP